MEARNQREQRDGQRVAERRQRGRGPHAVDLGGLRPEHALGRDRDRDEQQADQRAGDARARDEEIVCGLQRHRRPSILIAPLSSETASDSLRPCVELCERNRQDGELFPRERRGRRCSRLSAMDPASAGMSGLSAVETRVLGCLLEKQRTTPEQYPLSLNALRLACNQSTNRDPVVDYDEATIRDALHRLERRKLVRFASGSRAAKYRHLLEEALPLQGGRASGPDRSAVARRANAGRARAARRADACVRRSGRRAYGAGAVDRARTGGAARQAPGAEGGALRAVAAGPRRRRGGGRARLSAPEAGAAGANGGEAGLTAPSPSAATSAPSAADEPRPDAAELQELRERVELQNAK